MGFKIQHLLTRHYEESLRFRRISFFHLGTQLQAHQWMWWHWRTAPIVLESTQHPQGSRWVLLTKQPWPLGHLWALGWMDSWAENSQMDPERQQKHYIISSEKHRENEDGLKVWPFKFKHFKTSVLCCFQCQLIQNPSQARETLLGHVCGSAIVHREEQQPWPKHFCKAL